MPLSAQNRDDDYVIPRLAVLNSDPIQGLNIVPIQINSQNQILCNTIDTISFTMRPVDPRNANDLGLWLFKGLDGKTYPAVANANGELLITI
jgi:hypothetical protein